MSKRKRYDERHKGEEWLLEILTERAFRLRSGELQSRRVDGNGLVVWNDIESDVTVNQLGLHTCSMCGHPARTAIFDLQSKKRTLLCESCHPRDERRER